MLLALRINVLVKGYRLVRFFIHVLAQSTVILLYCSHFSGIRLETLLQAVEALNG